MVLAYDIPISTMDIDGLLIKSEVTLAELDPLVKKVSKDLGLDPQWFNSYFDTYTFTIPSDYESRLKCIYKGDNLEVYALGLEDLLIMKCFAGREKDIGHAKGLMKKKIDLELVERHLEALSQKELPGSQEALDFFDDLKDQLGI